MPAIKRLIALPLTRPSMLGAVLAVVVGVATFIYLGDGEANAADPVAISTTPVLVASQDIDARTRLAESHVEVVDLPSTAVHPQALRTVDRAEDLFASGFIAAGEQILPHKLSTDVFGGGLAQLVPEGQRAVSIAISNAAAAGGLVSPGDHIDIIAIFSEELRDEAGTSIIAEDVEVLALSQLVLGEELGEDESSPTAGQSPNAVSATVTVAVSLDNAQRIALAEAFGDLHVFLRHPDDDSEPFAAPVDLESVVRG
jgi:pilus assembly protein CpaB